MINLNHYRLDGLAPVLTTSAHTFSDFGDVQGVIIGDTFHTTANDVRLYCEALAREVGEDDAAQAIEDVLDAADIHSRTPDDAPVTLRVHDFAIEVA